MPVLLLFDNEGNGKPLAQFLKFCSMSARQEPFRIDLYTALPDSNLYLVTNPLVKDKKECEIEDLFPDSILDTVIDGKRFVRKGEDMKTTYGKDVFSKYVIAHYSAIDFSNFKPLLNAISSSIAEYTASIKEKGQ